MNGAPTSSKFRVLGRDDGGDGGGGGLSTSTIIIIAVVCGCVAILVLALFLWRLLARCCRPKEPPVPLPPVQELAHHRRDQQRAAFAGSLTAPGRPGTWTDGSSRTPYSGSAVSLLTNPEKVSSIYTDEVTTAESTLPSPDGEDRLYPPNPSFYRASDASSSQNTLPDNASTSHSSLVSPSPSAPISESVSNTSHVTTHSRSQSRQVSVTRPPSSRSRVPSRGRPLSQGSDSPTTYSGFTTRSSSVLRSGVPHRSSTMQIVLPAPLGPQSTHPSEGPALYTNKHISRSSVFADPWLASSNEARNSAMEPSADARTRSSSRSRSRHKHAASAAPPAGTMPPVGPARRAASQQSRSRSNLVQPPEAQVPRPPYGDLADLAESTFDGDAARGRPRSTSTRLTRIPSGQVSQ